MTCMKQEFCIHEKYCQRHIGQNFDSCILFSRNSKPMTNDEWLRQASTEQLAEWMAHQTMIALLENQNNHSLRMTYPAYWVEWLKQPHTVKE